MTLCVTVWLVNVGLLLTKRRLDRETMADHRVSVVAEDGGGLQCRSVVHVRLTDVNDNAPQFVPRLHYAGSVAENAPIGTPVLRVTAVDADLGLSRKVRYSMEPPHAGVMFAVDAVSGVVTLLQSLDRERQALYNVTVSASDQVCASGTLGGELSSYLHRSGGRCLCCTSCSSLHKLV